MGPTREGQERAFVDWRLLCIRAASDITGQLIASHLFHKHDMPPSPSTEDEIRKIALRTKQQNR